jgi:hypothetical protein
MRKVFMAGLIIAAVLQGCAMFEMPHGNYGYGNDYLVLRVFPDRYCFYRGADMVAQWDFQPDGTCVKRGVEINGTVKMFYATGKVAAEITYKNNRRHGDYRSYNADGAVIEKGSYNEGARNEGWQNFSDSGKAAAPQAEGNKTSGNNWDWGTVNKEDSYNDFKRDDSAPAAKNEKNAVGYYGENPFEKQNDQAPEKERGGRNH